MNCVRGVVAKHLAGKPAGGAARARRNVVLHNMELRSICSMSDAEVKPAQRGGRCSGSDQAADCTDMYSE